jgi:Helix-loop-helix DNA-binding domain
VISILDAPNISSKETHNDEFSYSHKELRRKYRNAREKERSCLITQQIHELQRLLSLGGFLTPSKDSKSSILEKTAKYIKFLQQDQHESEIDRQRILNRLHAITTASERSVRNIQEQSTEDVVLPNYYIHPSESLGYDRSIIKRQNFLRKTHDPDMHPLEDFEYHLIVEACSAGIVS